MPVDNYENFSHSISKFIRFNFFRNVFSRGMDWEICKSDAFFFYFYLIEYTILYFFGPHVYIFACQAYAKLIEFHLFSLLIRVEGVFLDWYLFFYIL